MRPVRNLAKLFSFKGRARRTVAPPSVTEGNGVRRVDGVQQQKSTAGCDPRRGLGVFVGERRYGGGALHGQGKPEPHVQRAVGARGPERTWRDVRGVEDAMTGLLLGRPVCWRGICGLAGRWRTRWRRARGECKSGGFGEEISQGRVAR